MTKRKSRPAVHRESRSAVLSPKDEGKKNPWQDFFDALDMFDPRFPLVRDQPPHQVRKSMGMVQPPQRKRARSKEG